MTASHPPSPPASRSRRRASSRNAATTVPRQVALALLDRALEGDPQALRDLRTRLDLPGTHQGPAKSVRYTLGWKDEDSVGFGGLGLRLPVAGDGRVRWPSLQSMQQALRRLAARLKT